jgi:hypothetical protein
MALIKAPVAPIYPPRNKPKVVTDVPITVYPPHKRIRVPRSAPLPKMRVTRARAKTRKTQAR